MAYAGTLYMGSLASWEGDLSNVGSGGDLNKISKICMAGLK